MFSFSPYRGALRSRAASGSKRIVDRDLLPVFALLWAMSVAVVVRCLFRHDTFGSEATLALALVVALPALVLGSRGRVVERDVQTTDATRMRAGIKDTV
jgi:hypothetical protein